MISSHVLNFAVSSHQEQQSLDFTLILKVILPLSHDKTYEDIDRIIYVALDIQRHNFNIAPSTFVAIVLFLYIGRTFGCVTVQHQRILAQKIH